MIKAKYKDLLVMFDEMYLHLAADEEGNSTRNCRYNGERVEEIRFFCAQDNFRKRSLWTMAC